MNFSFSLIKKPQLSVQNSMLLYADFRIGGKPRFILANKPPKLMYIPDAVRKCVVFVGYRLPTDELSLQGTAFIVGRPIEGTDKIFLHLVTAAHVIQGIALKATDGKVCLRVNFKDGNAQTVETDIDDWLFHPEDSTIDVAVLPFVVGLQEKSDITIAVYEMFLDEKIRTEEDIGIGDDVFLTGLFYNHSGRARNIPIVRVGNIAALPEEKVRTPFGFIDAYLVEARSIGGLSGSPVFVHLGADRKQQEGRVLIGTGKRGSTFYLLGLMHGHYKIDVLNVESDTDNAEELRKEAINMGIAIVVPSEKIMEVLNQPAIRDREIGVENKLREELLPTLDSVLEGVVKSEDFT